MAASTAAYAVVVSVGLAVVLVVGASAYIHRNRECEGTPVPVEADQ